MTKEFEGRTEQEAIAKAIDELHIEREDFDVEIVDSGRKGLFKKNMVKIRVHIGEDEEDQEDLPFIDDSYDDHFDDVVVSSQPLAPEGELEEQVVEFVATLLSKMGYPGTVTINFRKDHKLGLNIDSEFSSIIIGRKGKNLDAIQLLANVYAGQIDPDQKIIVDSENYRMRHEEQLIRLAYKTAEQVKRTGRSKLLEPMNPFERRLIHSALNDVDGVDTKSEGDGLYKQVRISCTRR
ncbi:MAG: RNA-binding cell elongation regulator Jag/EloR [Sphaerochaetaceae bacterium]|jgi:spoIIIJ-associated protein